jgi:hypothetical protein
VASSWRGQAKIHEQDHVLHSSTMDDEIAELIAMKPSQFYVSLLPSYKAELEATMRADCARSVAEVFTPNLLQVTWQRSAQCDFQTTRLKETSFSF